MKGGIRLPEAFITEENLSSNLVDGDHVRKLWEAEIGAKKALRLLYHLKREDLYPDHFQTMHVGAAVRFFSLQTAAGIETAVHLKLLPRSALSTAKFIRTVQEWFSLMSSKIRKTSLTVNNKGKKYTGLQKIIELFQHIVIKDGWKPLNKGMIMSSLSALNYSEYLFNCGYDFILLHRFNQDCLLNVFSQVRSRSSETPSALEVLKAMKTISVAQFVSDIKNTNYANDSDIFLLDCLEKKKSFETSTSPMVYPPISGYKHAPLLEEKFKPIAATHVHNLNSYDLNIMYNIGGSTSNSVLKHVCKTCASYLKEVPTNIGAIKFYKECLNKGGLKDPSNNTLCNY